MWIIVDGYNLLWAGPDWRRLEREDRGAGREALLRDLDRYRLRKGHRMTVVFDGAMGVEGRGRASGVSVIYSARGEQADAVIRRLAAQEASATVVVTSDRAVASAVEAAGATAMSSGEFLGRLEQTLLAEAKGEEGEGEPRPAKGKGAARRPSKGERRRAQRLRSL